ncbi:hypothetical protein ACJVC5_11890 [Peredibacter sp. HCB2-198]|uniref:hypothetical protein n=1 Tax=Peredibacter sp. HCB2-198 TaxID=3383025 RepID=UPI0038B4DA09
MDQTLRPINEKDIPHIIEKAVLFGGKITQSNPNSTVEMGIKRVDVDVYGTMTIKLMEAPPIEKKRPISITFNYRSLFFYLDPTQYVLKEDTIVADLPKGAKAIAIRHDDRYVMPHNTEVKTTIHRIEKRLESCPLEVKIVDVSANGLGLLISNHGDRALLPNDHIWVKALSDMVLKKPIFGRIVYTIIKKYKDNSLDLRVGVSLEEAIPEEVFTELQKKSNLILSA